MALLLVGLVASQQDTDYEQLQNKITKKLETVMKRFGAGSDMYQTMAQEFAKLHHSFEAWKEKGDILRAKTYFKIDAMNLLLEWVERILLSSQTPQLK
jgi:hypothetical protein